MTNKPNINLPQGIKDILPSEATKIVKAEGAILSVFSSYGYERVVTPMLEYKDVLDLGTGEDFDGRVVKFIDPSTGRLVAIRPDITPQIARMVATRMKDMPRPLKLCYSENVLRYEEVNGTKIREVIQVGAEFIEDSPSIEADSEMIIMAIESLKKIGVSGFKVDIGHIGFARALFAELDGNNEEIEKVKKAISKKDVGALEEILNKFENEVPEDLKNAFSILTNLYGGEEVIAKAEAIKFKINEADYKTDIQAEWDKSLTNLNAVVESVNQKGYGEYLGIDLGEIRSFEYYTGIIFEGFSSGSGKALLSGGRYDNLMERYGCVCSATGFAFDMSAVVSSKSN